MAINEAARKIDIAIVKNVTPDVCLTKMGSAIVPVIYEIYAEFDQSQRVSRNVRFGGQDAFTMDSRISRVIGNSPSIGGILSGVKEGYVRPMTHSTTVRVNKSWVIYHSSMMWMNCSGPEGPGNCFGKVIYVTAEELVALQEAISNRNWLITQQQLELERYAEMNWLERRWEDTKDLAETAWDVAVVFQEKTKIVQRVLGVVQVVDGVKETVIGVGMVLAPEVLTSVVGVAVTAHGVDTTWAGLKQAWTGEWQETYTEQGITEVAKSMGASETTAGWIGVGGDTLIGILAPSRAINRAVREGMEEGLEAGAKRSAKELGEEATERGIKEAAPALSRKAADDLLEEVSEDLLAEAAERAFSKNIDNIADGIRITGGRLTRKQIGDLGEEYAAEVFKKEGYEVLGSIQNRSNHGIDLVLRKNGDLSFVEVKATTGKYVAPLSEQQKNPIEYVIKRLERATSDSGLWSGKNASQEVKDLAHELIDEMADAEVVNYLKIDIFMDAQGNLIPQNSKITNWK